MSIEIRKQYDEKSETGSFMIPHFADCTKFHDLDRMLAQLVFLDTALEDKKKEKRRIRKKQQKIKARPGR